MGAAQGKEFGFDLQEGNAYYHGKTHWTLNAGVKKADKTVVSVFFFDGKQHSSLVPLATNCFKRFRTLRHPHLLSFIDGLDFESTFNIVTEKVNPLGEVLEDFRKFPNSIYWGLYQVASGLAFLHQVKLTFGNVNLNSIFVNKAGDWKLGLFDYVSDIKDTSSPLRNNNSSIPNQYKSPEFQKSTWQQLEEAPPSAIDSWMFGCLIYEIYNGKLEKTEDLKKVGSIPRDLLPLYQKLLLSNPSTRLELSKILENDVFQNNVFVESCLFLENIALKDSFEKEKFIKKLTTSIDDFPEAYCKYKVLPLLLSSMDPNAVNPTILTPVLKIGKLLSEQEFTDQITPSLVKWFANQDRNLRMTLLSSLESFAQYLSTNVIETQIFPSMANGFLDSLPALREASLKALIFLVPKMSSRFIDAEVLKYLAKLQADEEPGIRTNATICIAKLSSYFANESRDKILIVGLCKPLRDVYPRARIAGLVSLIATQNVYNKVDCATKILPSVVPLLIDSEKDVRDNAFKCVNIFMEKLQKFSDGIEDTSNTAEKANNDSGMLGWALGTLTKKIIRSDSSTSTTAAPTNTQTQNAGTIDKEKEKEKEREREKSSSENSTPFSTPKPQQKSFGMQLKPETKSNEQKDGWDNNDEFDIDHDEAIQNVKTKDFFSSPSQTSKHTNSTNTFTQTQTQTQTQATKRNEKKSDGWEADGWDNDEDDSDWNFKVDDFKPAKEASSSKTGKKD